jgi:hypothetical protein
MTYFFKLYIYDKLEWVERGSFLRHHGLYSTIELAFNDLLEDIRYDHKHSTTSESTNFITSMIGTPMLPLSVREGKAIWEKIHVFETENTIYDIYCFKLIQ